MRGLPEVPALAAWLLGGDDGRPPAEERAPAVGHALPAWAGPRRLAGELAASPRLADAGLPRAAVRALAVEREAARATGEIGLRALARCGEALAARGVEALLYKGAAVVVLTHGDVSRRPMADLDLIVRPAARADAREALLAAGLEATGADTALHDVLRDPTCRGPGHPLGVAVEVHADVFPPPHPFALRLGECFDRATPHLPGILQPDPADAVILSAFHFALYETDGRKAWMTLRDVALLVEEGVGAAGDVFAETLRERADARDLCGVVGGVLRRATALAGGPAAALPPFELPSRSPWLRRAFLKASFSELDRALANEGGPGRRHLALRVAAAAWQPTAWSALCFAGRRAFGAGGAVERCRRYVAAAWRSLRG